MTSASKTQKPSDDIPTGSLSIYAADHQLIRLLAELEGISSAELIHQALRDIFEKHRDELTELIGQTQATMKNEDPVKLCDVLSKALLARRAARARRLSELSGSEPSAD